MEARALRYESAGAGEPVVLVPGGLTGWLSWIPHQERLARRYRPIRVQPIHNELGSAGEPGRPGYTAETEREALRLTIDELGLERPHLAGWSGGGRAALEFATEYPERVRSLTLVEPAASWILEQLGEETDEGNDFLRDLAGKEVTEDDLARFLVMAGFASTVDEARSDPSWERWVAHRMALSWQSEELDSPKRSLGDLDRITCPTMLVRGTRTVDLERRTVEVLADRLPAASLVVLEGDHASHIQSIDDFMKAFEAHLAAADGGSAGAPGPETDRGRA